MRSPRVLMLSDVYFPRVNGVSTSIQTFRKDLDRLGCTSVLVAPEYPQSRDDEPGVVRVRSRYFPFDPEDRVLVARDLKRAVLELHCDFDLIHIHTPFLAHAVGLGLSRRLGIPVVETYHTFFEEYFHHYLLFLPGSLLRAAARAISRRQCNAVDAIVAPSPQMAEVLRDYGVESEIQVIPTGPDLARLAGGNGARFRAQYGIGHDRPVALTVGRVAFEKNIAFLISVLARVRVTVPDILLIIAGEGPALVPLRRRVEQAGLANHVCFFGYLDRAGPLLDCYRSADAFIFASRTETQGLVLLEAMALGLPVVSTAVIGTKSVLDGARGALVVAEDEIQFASALEKVLLDRELRASLAAQATRFVESRWSSAEMAERMLKLYQGAIRRAPVGTAALSSAAPTLRRFRTVSPVFQDTRALLWDAATRPKPTLEATMKTLAAVIASLLITPALAEDVGHEHHPAAAAGDEKALSPLVQKVRKATARFRDVNVALGEGYSAGPCVSGPNRGAMGVHLINANLLTKEVDAETPEALIYEPSPNGRMRLVGVEIITLASDWVDEVPVLDGHLLHYVGAPNRYGIPAFYEIHVWAWRNNPDGTFADWNPRVTCAGQPLPAP